jgi:hypothetical protein
MATKAARQAIGEKTAERGAVSGDCSGGTLIKPWRGVFWFVDVCNG